MARHPLIPCAMLALALAVPGQRFADRAGSAGGARGLSLARGVPSPLLYLSIQPHGGRHRGVQVRRLLTDPTLSRWLGLGQLAAADRDQASDTLGLASDLLGRTEALGGGMELACTGVAARGIPLLVFRADLGDEVAARLASLLRRPEIATEHREVNGHRTFFPKLGERARGVPPIELALVEDQLLVSNDGTTLTALLGGSRRTRAGGVPLARQAAFRSLRARLDVGPGSMVVYADLAQLSSHAWGGGRSGTHWLLRWSGLSTTARLACAIQPAAQALRTTVLLDDGGATDGWWHTATQVKAHRLVTRLPVVDAGGIVLAVEAERVLGDGTVAAHAGAGLAALRAALTDGCSQLGLEPGAPLFERLGDTLAIALLGGRGSGEQVGADPGLAALQPAYSLHAKSAAAARSLFGECVQRVEERGVEAEQHREDGGAELLRFRPGAPDSLWLSVLDDALVLGAERMPIDRLHAAAGRSAEHRRARRRASNVLGRLGVFRAPVLGVFRVDLSPRDRAADPDAAGGSLVERSHVGFLQRTEGLLRVEMETEL